MIKMRTRMKRIDREPLIWLNKNKSCLALTLLAIGTAADLHGEVRRPNIVLVMADDQGWAQVGYQGHPHLKTPNLDAMAEGGLRFDRFYAAGPVCSPTRASVLTARTPVRTGVPSHGHNLCLQEKTLPQAVKEAGYATGHFGKWHLNGVRGPGVPILGDDPNHPGKYGFDEWVSVTNFFDLDPLMSRMGEFEQFEGDSSDVTVAEALKFIARQKEAGTPSFSVIWYGSPHSPMSALEGDLVGVPDPKLDHHLGEIVAIDRSVGTLRKGLRDLGIEKDTLVWYCSDNGGLSLDPDGFGQLRGHKGNVWEGGIRVPGIVEWPGQIKPAVTGIPASTMDMMPTIIDLLGLPESLMMDVRDGESLTALFRGQPQNRNRAIPFVFHKQAALIDGRYKLLSNATGKDRWSLYDLDRDPGETNDLAEAMPEQFQKMKAQAKAVLKSVEASAAGKDYPEGKVIQPPRRAFWRDMDEYRPHLKTFGHTESAGGKRASKPAQRKRRSKAPQ